MSKTKDIDINYQLIPMSEITDHAREIAKRWYDGVSEINDIREKHKLASDIMNYAKQECIEFFLDTTGGYMFKDNAEQLYQQYLQSKTK